MILSHDPAAISVFSLSMVKSEISAEAPRSVASSLPSRVLQILTSVSSAPVMMYLVNKQRLRKGGQSDPGRDYIQNLGKIREVSEFYRFSKIDKIKQ